MQSADLGLNGPSFMPLQGAQYHASLHRFTRRNRPSHRRPARSRALCAPRHSAHALLARIWTRLRTRLRREGPVARSSPRRRGRASCRLFAERKLPADPRGNALLSCANAHGQLSREGATTPALGPVNVPHALRVVDFACGSEHVLCVLESGGQTEVGGWGWNEHGDLATGS